MLEKRIIPALLLHKGGLYKTHKFKKPNYLGDPINAIRIFNEKEVDELFFLDIDATVLKQEPNYALIEDIASECFMPLCYGGGIKTIEQMKKIYALGVEKISLSSSLLSNPDLLSEAASIFGRQSVVATVDVKKNFWGKYEVVTHNATKRAQRNPLEFIIKLEKMGAGEIVINDVDHDGAMQGYNIPFLSEIKRVTHVPIVALGGCGNLLHIKELFEATGITAAAAGSMFVYHGPLKGVLINYPKRESINTLLESETQP
jgi:imidazole glycerol-phosphate synthase subunit HisF